MEKKPKTQEVTEVDPHELRNAQLRSGLTDAQVATRLHVSDTTWKRWRKTGALPTIAVPAVARVFALPELLGHFDVGTPTDSMLRREVADVKHELHELRELLERLAEPEHQAN